MLSILIIIHSIDKKYKQADVKFEFLRLSTIKNCPHMLKSDHRWWWYEVIIETVPISTLIDLLKSSSKSDWLSISLIGNYLILSRLTRYKDPHQVPPCNEYFDPQVPQLLADLMLLTAVFNSCLNPIIVKKQI